MAIKTLNGYRCSYCNREFPSQVLADSCRDAHEIIYLPITKEDLNRLLQFIRLNIGGEYSELLTESLIKSLYKHRPKAD